MVFNTTFNNISAISWRLVLFVKETRGPGQNHRHDIAEILLKVVFNTISQTFISFNEEIFNAELFLFFLTPICVVEGHALFI